MALRVAIFKSRFDDALPTSLSQYGRCTQYAGIASLNSRQEFCYMLFMAQSLHSNHQLVAKNSRRDDEEKNDAGAKLRNDNNHAVQPPCCGNCGKTIRMREDVDALLCTAILETVDANFEDVCVYYVKRTELLASTSKSRK